MGYTFDLRANTLTPTTVPNPDAGREHEFRAWREASGSREPVILREPAQIVSDVAKETEEEICEE